MSVTHDNGTMLMMKDHHHHHQFDLTSTSAAHTVLNMLILLLLLICIHIQIYLVCIYFCIQWCTLQQFRHFNVISNRPFYSNPQHCNSQTQNEKVNRFRMKTIKRFCVFLLRPELKRWRDANQCVFESVYQPFKAWQTVDVCLSYGCHIAQPIESIIWLYAQYTGTGTSASTRPYNLPF